MVNGNLITCEKQDSVFLIKEDRKHLVPCNETYNALFKNCEIIHQVTQTEFDSIPLGKPLSENACLIKADTSDSVYLYSNGTKSHISSVNDFNSIGLNRNKIKRFSQQKIDEIPEIANFIVGNDREVILEKKCFERFDKAMQGVAYGRIENIEASGLKGGQVLLPTDWESRGTKKYPILYLEHGLGADSNEWIIGGCLRYLIGNMVAKCMISEMIVVVPNIFHTSESQSERSNSYYTFKPILKTKLLPYIEQEKYKENVYGDANHRAIAGLSLGGRASLYHACALRDNFHFVGSFGASFNLINERDGWINREENFVLGTGKNHFVYIANGEMDTITCGAPKYYSDVLIKNGVDNKYIKNIEGKHDIDTFKKMLCHFLSYDFFE